MLVPRGESKTGLGSPVAFDGFGDLIARPCGKYLVHRVGHAITPPRGVTGPRAVHNSVLFRMLSGFRTRYREE